MEPTESTSAVKSERKARKPRPKPERRIRVLEQPSPDTDGWGAISIQVGKKVDTYLVRFIPTDFGAGALGFELEKLDADLQAVEQYHVLLAGPETSCDCKGCSRHGHCKHAEGLAALRQAGKLLPYRSAGDYAANDPEGFRRHMESLTDGDMLGQLPPWADFDPREEDIDPDPAA